MDLVGSVCLEHRISHATRCGPLNSTLSSLVYHIIVFSCSLEVPHPLDPLQLKAQSQNSVSGLVGVERLVIRRRSPSAEKDSSVFGDLS